MVLEAGIQERITVGGTVCPAGKSAGPTASVAAFPQVSGQIQELTALDADVIVTWVMFGAMPEVSALLAVARVAALCVRNRVHPDKLAATVLLAEIIYSLSNLTFVGNAARYRWRLRTRRKAQR